MYVYDQVHTCSDLENMEDSSVFPPEIPLCSGVLCYFTEQSSGVETGFWENSEVGGELAKIG